MELMKVLRKSAFIRCGYYVLCSIPGRIFGRAWDEYKIKRRYKKTFGREPNLKDPQTLNEKIQWIKLHERDDFRTICADKYTARQVWSKYGEDGLVPLLFHTDDWRELTLDKIPEFPCIIKCSSGAGFNMIIRNKNDVNIKKLQRKCQIWLWGTRYYYYSAQEWQYKNIKPSILIEKLLIDKDGRIPNDYKLHFINGKLAFIYCSIDREGKNYRNVYSPEWKRINMEWVPKTEHKGFSGKDIPCPASFPRMVEIGQDMAKHFKYVRLDFYDLDGKLYYGEITLTHGAGFDTFEPEEYDLYYGKMLKLQR